VAVDAGLVVRIETERLPPDGRRLVSLHPRPADVFRELERLGHTPLPPYVRRPDGPADRERYQRVKRELARRDWRYVQQYADAKTEVVEEIIARAQGQAARP